MVVLSRVMESEERSGAMSERLEPGRLVRWQHDGGWKVGRVLMEYYDEYEDTEFAIVQCSEGLYSVLECDGMQDHQTRKERGEE